MKVITTSPFRTPLRLSVGVDFQSPVYEKILAALPLEHANVDIPESHKNRSVHKYANLKGDDYDLRLFIFSPPTKKTEPSIRFHIYGNGISIVTVEFEAPKKLGASALEQYSQEITQSTFDKYAIPLKKLFEDLLIGLPKSLLEADAEIQDITHRDLCWISRAVILSRDKLKNPAAATFTVDWLKNTARPEDAQAILDGTLTESMTWLNYLIVEPDAARQDMLFSALRIAQYFYASQENLNTNAYAALTNSTLEKNLRHVERNLIDARRQMQMLHIKYDMQKSFLNRQKRKIVEDLMEVWEFDLLKTNGNRMVAASNTQITEITNKRVERSSFFTDLILVGLALVTVIEVSMYLTEYSREMMSRPALAYQDDQASWILSTIAAIDTDQMLIGGAFVILILVGFYVYWKIKR